MTAQHFYESHRYGSARFADPRDLAASGMLQPRLNSLFCGFFGDQPLWYDGAGGVVLVAGARSGKLRDILSYTICTGVLPRASIIALDPKGEMCAISQDQTADRKFRIDWNPAGLHGLCQHRINPLDYLRSDSLTLVSDLKSFCESAVPLSGSTNAEYFELRAREFLEGICLGLTAQNAVLSYPVLYDAINALAAYNERWLDLAYQMSLSDFPLARRVEEEIAKAQGEDNPSGGYRGILGELFKSVSCLSDPALMASVSPHADGAFDFSFADLIAGKQAYQVYLMPPAEFIGIWSPVIKAMFVAAMIYKARAASAPRQTWIIDEAAQLKKFPLLVKLFTYGAGIGVRPVAVYQSIEQMEETAPRGQSIILSSAACQIFFALRDYGSAQFLSNMLGAQTLEFDEALGQEAANLRHHETISGILSGADPLMAAARLREAGQARIHRSKMARALMSADEVLNAGDDTAFVFADGVGAPILARRAPYYAQRFMAGRYHPNPYHPPLDRVPIKTRWGKRMARVKQSAVPRRFAHFPQYKDGLWSTLT